MQSGGRWAGSPGSPGTYGHLRNGHRGVVGVALPVGHKPSQGTGGVCSALFQTPFLLLLELGPRCFLSSRICVIDKGRETQVTIPTVGSRRGWWRGMGWPEQELRTSLDGEQGVPASWCSHSYGRLIPVVPWYLAWLWTHKNHPGALRAVWWGDFRIWGRTDGG